MTKNEIDVRELMEQTYVVPQSPFDNKRTKTTHFMMNTLFSNLSLISTDYFVNSFLDDEEFDGAEYLTRPIFILFKSKVDDGTWMKIAQQLRTKQEYVLEYFCGIQGDRNLTMMVFQVPPKWGKDYILFKQGKYSQFSPEYKKLFNRYIHDEKGQPKESNIWRVLHKSPELREELQQWIGTSEGDYKFTEEDELWGIVTPMYEHYRWKDPDKVIKQ